METQEIDFLNAHLCVSAVMFCKQCLAYTLHVDWCYPNHSSKSQHISVLTVECSTMTFSKEFRILLFI